MSKVKLDFTGVENFQKASEGQHVARIIKAEEASASTGSDMIKITFEVTTGADKGCKVFENYVLSENSLWKLKALLNAIGVKADGKVIIDLDKLIGKVCIIEVVHEEYNGSMRAKISDYKLLAAKSSSKDEDDEDDTEDEEEEEKPNKKADKKADKKVEKKSSKKVEEDEDDEDDFDDEDEDEEEEKKPAKKPSKKVEEKSKKADKKSSKKPSKDEDEDDEDEDEDDDWDENED